jgi:matrix metalloproteinase-14 (membrane-inserted)
MTDHIPPACKTLANDVVLAQAELKAAQDDLQHAVGSENEAAAAAVKVALNKLQSKKAALHHCVKTTDLLTACPVKPDSFYKLPFENDPAWQLKTGNSDDPSGSVHTGLQAFAFDFVNVDADGQGQAGKKILAARPGKVVAAVDSEVASSWQVGTAFVFKDNQYLKFNLSPASGPVGVVAGYPRSLQSPQSDFPGWPAGWWPINAAVNWGNGKVYFFRGAQYVLWDVATNKMDKGPTALNANDWPGWPPLWNSGIDAAINWGNGKVYFFRKDKYIRYDVALNQVDKDYPMALDSAHWSMWPADWNSGIDTAINWTSGSAYFFKNDKYLRYIMSPIPDHVDSGYPQPFDGTPFKPGWPSAWNTGIDAAVVWGTGYLGVGNYLILQHGDGTFGVYWHFQKGSLQVKIGNNVERGDFIGLSGGTGNASTPHLHMDVRTGWDFGYPALGGEKPSILIHFEDQNHTCWVPRVGQVLTSDNSQ